MNRRERRATKATKVATGSDDDLRQRTLDMMALGLRSWITGNPAGRPHFRLPGTDGDILIGCIDQVPIAVNEDARALVDLFCMVGRSIATDAEPTIEMLREVLDHVGVPYERVPISEFGTFTLLRPGSRAKN